MNTHIIVINGLPVEFSQQMPTRAGPYWWTHRIGDQSTSVRLRDVWNPCSDVLIDRITDFQPKDVAGWWSTYPLIPSIEVKNAHSEGWNDRANGDFLHEAQAWEESMACKVFTQHPVT